MTKEGARWRFGAAEGRAARTQVCYQELEKVDMIPLQREVAAYIVRSGVDICVPARDDALFQRSYPIEQYHSVRLCTSPAA